MAEIEVLAELLKVLAAGGDAGALAAAAILWRLWREVQRVKNRLEEVEAATKRAVCPIKAAKELDR